MTYTYRQSLHLIGRGMWSIANKLPGTFARNTIKIIVNHPVYLLFFASIITWQAGVISNERLQRDAGSKHLYEVQQQLDSLQGKNIKFRAYK